MASGTRTDLTYDSTGAGLGMVIINIQEMTVLSCPHISKKPSTGLIKAKEYCQGFGFSWTTVKRWCEKLLDPEKKEIERQIRNVSCN